MHVFPMIALVWCAGAAVAEPLPDPLKAVPAAPRLQDASGRFSLAPLLVAAPPTAQRSASGRYALHADLDAVMPALPHNARYTLQSRLGEQTQGSCGAPLPDPLFRNGFEN